MQQVPDGIFDMVRAICTLSGIKVLFDTAQISLSELYIDDCPTCGGAGMMTCPFCKGSKTLRSRPMRLVRNSKGTAMMLHTADALNECWHCGPSSKLDFKMESDDVTDEMESLRIMENFSAAMAGRPMPFEWEPLAGTVPCATCMGSKVMHRHTPNIGKVFALEDDMWTKIEKKVGVPTYSGQSREFFKVRRLSAFLEYPKHPEPFPEEMIEFPTLRVHPILLPELEDVEKDEKPNPEDISNPFLYGLPWLEMKSELNVGDPEAFP